MVKIVCENPYFDLRMNKKVSVGEMFETDADRAKYLIKLGFCVEADE